MKELSFPSVGWCQCIKTLFTSASIKWWDSTQIYSLNLLDVKTSYSLEFWFVKEIYFYFRHLNKNGLYQKGTYDVWREYGQRLQRCKWKSHTSYYKGNHKIMNF